MADASMTFADLESRVRDFVRQHPGLTLTEIARGVRARTASVLDVLAAEEFSACERGAHAADRAQVYRLVVKSGEKSGRAARRSQCALIAEVLADGRPHSTAEIHRACGFSRLNSRIAELRRIRGMVIVCEHTTGNGPDAYEYTFVGYKPGFGTSSETDGRPPAPSVSPDASATHEHDSLVRDGDLLSGSPAGASDSQLEIGEAA